MYYRLLVPNVLRDVSIHRCIYIDVDVLCLSEIGTFFDTNLQGKVAAVVFDIGIHIEIEYQERNLTQLGWEVDSLYFNSGVMLIDVKAWHEHDIERKFIELMKVYVDKKFHRYPDQDVLNVILQNLTLVVSEKFNWQYCWYLPDHLRHCSNLVVFAHFLGEGKPWRFSSRHPVYDSYFLSSPWGEYLPPKLEERGRFHKLYAGYLMSVQGDKALIKKHLWIYLWKKLKLL